MSDAGKSDHIEAAALDPRSNDLVELIPYGPSSFEVEIATEGPKGNQTNNWHEQASRTLSWASFLFYFILFSFCLGFDISFDNR
jgi:hypothetical protein